MKKIERRAFVCLALALLLAAGLCLFLARYFLDGGEWASSAFNRHLYNTSGELASGTVLDRDGDILSEVVDGRRTYYDDATVRRATLHAVGDLQGNIGTGALNAFADQLTGYSLLNGACRIRVSVIDPAYISEKFVGGEPQYFVQCLHPFLLYMCGAFYFKTFLCRLQAKNGGEMLRYKKIFCGAEKRLTLPARLLYYLRDFILAVNYVERKSKTCRLRCGKKGSFPV